MVQGFMDEFGCDIEIIFFQQEEGFAEVIFRTYGGEKIREFGSDFFVAGTGD